MPQETPSDWQDPEAPWWAKLRRAARLIKEVNSCCDALNQPGVGWSLEREKLRMTRPGAITSANPDPSQQIWQLLSETWCTIFAQQWTTLLTTWRPGTSKKRKAGI